MLVVGEFRTPQVEAGMCFGDPQREADTLVSRRLRPRSGARGPSALQRYRPVAPPYHWHASAELLLSMQQR